MLRLDELLLDSLDVLTVELDADDDEDVRSATVDELELAELLELLLSMKLLVA